MSFDDAVKRTLGYKGHLRRYGPEMTSHMSIDGPLRLAELVPEHAVMAELGCHYGESTMFFWLSGKFSKIYAIDPYLPTYVVDGGVYECPDKSHIVENVIIPSDGVVKLLQTTSLEAASEIQDESLDLVYIDAIHTYDAVKADVTAYMPKLKKGGIMAGHDYNDTFRGVKRAVDELFGVPNKIYNDSSWSVMKF